MISRRQFVKRLLAAALALTGGGALVIQILKSQETNEAVVDASGTESNPASIRSTGYGRLWQ